MDFLNYIKQYCLRTKILFVTCSERHGYPPPIKFSCVIMARDACSTRRVPRPAGNVIVFRQGTLTSAPFAAPEIILPNALRRGRGRLTLSANIPLEVIAVLAKDVNLIHLLARCKQKQLGRYQDRVERFKKWRRSG